MSCGSLKPEYPISNKEYPIFKELHATTAFDFRSSSLFFLFSSSLDIPCWILDIRFPAGKAPAQPVNLKSLSLHPFSRRL